MDAQYKTQGWLEKFGWEEGKGLGKNLDGRSDIIHVALKNDSQGLGVQNYEHLDFAHWDNLYTKAASKIHITSSGEGVVLKKVETVAPRASVYGGMFVKSATESVVSSDVKGEDLFSECGGSELRIFKQEGKMKRLKEAEERGGLCNVTDYFGDRLSIPSEQTSNKRKREKSRSEKRDKKSKKQTKDSDKESKTKRDAKKDTKEKKSKDDRDDNKKERSQKRKEKESGRKDKSDKSDKKSKSRRKRQKTEHSA